MQVLTPHYLAEQIAAQCNGISAAQAYAYLAQKLAGVQSDYVWMFTSERDAEQLAALPSPRCISPSR